MRILMLGWEFPPFISGGLGTACRGLTDAMRRLEARILFVLPRSGDTAAEDPAEEGAARNPREEAGGNDGLRMAPVPSAIVSPYPATTAGAETLSVRAARGARRSPRCAKPSSVRVMGVGAEDGYDGDLLDKTRQYADRCVGLMRRELFEVIHAHDWMTFPAAAAIAEFSGRPLVVHVHATEFDRSGEWINPSVYAIERRGMEIADRVIAVSERTRAVIIERYGVHPEKVTVVHNGVDFDREAGVPKRPPAPQRTVLFLGRVTMQKGPEYFVRAAARVCERTDGVRFVMAGTGDLLPSIVRLVWDLGLQHAFEFPGFLRGDDVARAYRRADAYVMPSVSEPFGLTAVEAVSHGVPVILSRTSGVAEVLRRGALHVDFWDVELMARMILLVLRHRALADMLRRQARAEVRGLTWDEAARRCLRLYYSEIARLETHSTAVV